MTSTRKFNLASLQSAFSDNKESTKGPSDFYSLSKDLEVDSSVTLRLIEDTNEDNAFGAFVKSSKHSFQVDGQWHNVTCHRHTYGEQCALCDASAAFYAEGKPEIGKGIYQKTSILARVLIVDSDDKDLIGTVKNISFTKYMFQQVLEELGELETEAWHLDTGTDLVIKKSFVSGYNKYKPSFARKERSVNENEREAISVGAIDLSTLIAPRTDETKVQIALDEYLQSVSDD